jgi:hypothetical protein
MSGIQRVLRQKRALIAAVDPQQARVTQRTVNMLNVSVCRPPPNHLTAIDRVGVDEHPKP